MKNLTAAAALASQVDKKTVANVGKVLIAIALYLLLRSSARKRIAQNEYEKVVSGNGGAVNPASLALQFRQALQPWGVSILGIDGGTDEDTLYYLAGVCRGAVWPEVVQSYRTLYRTELLQDIADDASPEVYAKFLAILQGAAPPGTPTTPGSGGTPATGKTAETIRKTPLYSASNSTQVVTTLPLGTKTEFKAYTVSTSQGVRTEYVLVTYRNWIGFPTDGYIKRADVRVY